jgi:hypothetical protein
VHCYKCRIFLNRCFLQIEKKSVGEIYGCHATKKKNHLCSVQTLNLASRHCKASLMLNSLCWNFHLNIIDSYILIEQYEVDSVITQWLVQNNRVIIIWTVLVLIIIGLVVCVTIQFVKIKRLNSRKGKLLYSPR